MVTHVKWKVQLCSTECNGVRDQLTDRSDDHPVRVVDLDSPWHTREKVRVYQGESGCTKENQNSLIERPRRARPDRSTSGYSRRHGTLWGGSTGAFVQL